jgi:hypothetical protein
LVLEVHALETTKLAGHQLMIDSKVLWEVEVVAPDSEEQRQA